MRKPKAPTPAPAPTPPVVVPPKRGPGRPRKAGPPQSTEQVRLGQQVAQAELRREAAAAEYAKAKTVASELALLQGDLEVASSWSAYLRATNNHTHSLKWGDLASKYAARISALRELSAADLLQELSDRTRRENSVALRVAKL